MHTNLMIV